MDIPSFTFSTASVISWNRLWWMFSLSDVFKQTITLKGNFHTGDFNLT